jgi:hypothetical protein
MSLANWVANSWLRAEPTSQSEIAGFLSIVDRGLADAQVVTISADLRFIAAFNSALTAANAAVRATGHRIPTQVGHHVRTIESLELTLKSDSKLIQRFKVFNNKRNKSSYDVAGVTSEQELVSMVKLATDLRAELVAWLKQTYPELSGK